MFMGQMQEMQQRVEPDPILMKLVDREYITKEDLEEGLEYVCFMAEVCDNRCPVYQKVGSAFAMEMFGCGCHEDGKKMLRYLRDKKGKYFPHVIV